MIGSPHAARPMGRTDAPPRGQRVPLWAAAAAALALAAMAASLDFLARPKAAAPVRKLDLVAHDIAMDWFFAPMLSPDGGRIAYVANDKLLVRDLSQLDALAGTEIEGISPICWSQDSRTLYFNDRGKLWRVSSAGGGHRRRSARCRGPETSPASRRRGTERWRLRAGAAGCTGFRRRAASRRSSSTSTRPRWSTSTLPCGSRTAT